MAIPVLASIGTLAEGTTTVAPALPSGLATGDLMLALLAGGNQGLTWGINNHAGGSWTIIAQNDVGSSTTAANVAIISDYYNGTQTAPTFATPGNNGLGRIYRITGARAADESNFGGQGVNIDDTSGDTSCSLVSGLTTTDNDCLIFLVAGAADDSPTFGATWTNANLASLTIQASDTTIQGNDSSCEVVTGTLATAGAVGTYTNTLTGVVNVAALVLAIRPPAAAASSLIYTNPPMKELIRR